MEKFDYIIAGAGCAGLSLLMHMINSGRFSSNNILLVDKGPKTANDRTWCFWEKEAGLFEPVVHRRWGRMQFYGNDGINREQDISPYQYKLIRGIDFYNYCFAELAKHPNIFVEFGNVDRCYTDNGEARLQLNGRTLAAAYIFNSIISMPTVPQRGEYFLWQHFGGWFVKTARPVFDENIATLMDLRVEQKAGTHFVYLMPFSPTTALIEYTVFSRDRWLPEDYDIRLAGYVKQYVTADASAVSVIEKEHGSIPMTNHHFSSRTGRVINIGSAGGQTKPSTGYTFQFIQKSSAEIVKALIAGKEPAIPAAKNRFRFYDSVLLRVLTKHKLGGAEIFTTLFGKNGMGKVFRFLDNETSLGQELDILKSLPRSVFLQAAIGHLFRSGKKKSSKP